MYGFRYLRIRVPSWAVLTHILTVRYGPRLSSQMNLVSRNTTSSSTTGNIGAHCLWITSSRKWRKRWCAVQNCIIELVHSYNKTTCKLTGLPLVNTLFTSCSGAFGWGTALQAGRSQVRFLMMSLEFFIYIILQAALWPWCRFSI